ncbi:MAG: hypothetical protein JWO81_2435 [Alphaproteobacteria bacterium]|nr:hypothetical protein [Alphaproteobacteria bacterium]
MKKILLTLAAAAVAVAPAAAAPRLHGEAELAKLLEGRSAGAPVDCIDLSRVYSSHIVDRTAIVYEVGSTLYVNRPRAGAESLDSWDAMVLKPFDHELCRVDVVQMLDAGSHFMKGSVFLGDFVPYKKVAASR